MAKSKYDGVVVAVHYYPNKQVAWVRAYLRNGPIFTDRIVLDRQVLIEQLNAGKKFVVGNRVQYRAGTFKVSDPIKLISKNNETIIVAGEQQSEHDYLKGVPQI